MPQIRAHHEAISASGAPDITTNPPLLHRYLTEYYNRHRSLTLGFYTCSWVLGTYTVASLLTVPVVTDEYLIGALMLNAPFWVLSWYQRLKRNLVAPKIQAVEYQLQSLKTPATPVPPSTPQPQTA